MKFSLVSGFLLASVIHVADLEPVSIVYGVPWSDPSSLRPSSWDHFSRRSKSLLNTFPFNQPGIFGTIWKLTWSIFWIKSHYYESFLDEIIFTICFCFKPKHFPFFNFWLSPPYTHPVTPLLLIPFPKIKITGLRRNSELAQSIPSTVTFTGKPAFIQLVKKYEKYFAILSICLFRPSIMTRQINFYLFQESFRTLNASFLILLFSYMSILKSLFFPFLKKKMFADFSVFIGGLE